MADNVLPFRPRPRLAVARLAPTDQLDEHEQLERALEASLDAADHIIALLDRIDGDPDLKDGGDDEPSLGAPENHESNVTWLRGTTRDLELDHQ